MGAKWLDAPDGVGWWEVQLRDDVWVEVIRSVAQQMAKGYTGDGPDRSSIVYVTRQMAADPITIFRTRWFSGPMADERFEWRRIEVPDALPEGVE